MGRRLLILIFSVLANILLALGEDFEGHQIDERKDHGPNQEDAERAGNSPSSMMRSEHRKVKVVMHKKKVTKKAKANKIRHEVIWDGTFSSPVLEKERVSQNATGGTNKEKMPEAISEMQGNTSARAKLVIRAEEKMQEKMPEKIPQAQNETSPSKPAESLSDAHIAAEVQKLLDDLAFPDEELSTLIKRAEEAREALKKSVAATSRCHDLEYNGLPWQDVHGDSCYIYEYALLCNIDGSYGRFWSKLRGSKTFAQFGTPSATSVCCACGGGSPRMTASTSQPPQTTQPPQPPEDQARTFGLAPDIGIHSLVDENASDSFEAFFEESS